MWITFLFLCHLKHNHLIGFLGTYKPIFKCVIKLYNITYNLFLRPKFEFTLTL